MKADPASRKSITDRLKALIPSKSENHLAELGFLPAVLEIQETPPSPTGRVVSWLIMVLFFIGLVWAIFGEVDIVAVAQGKIIPSGHSKVIQSIEMANVKAIYVREGQSVRQGEVLIELDETITSADHLNVGQQKQALAYELKRLALLIEFIEINKRPKKDELADKLQQSILENQIQEYIQQLSALGNTARQKQSEYLAVSATVEKLEETLPIVEKRMSTFRTLYEQKMGSEQQFLEMKQAYIENRQELKTESSHLQEIAAEKEKINAQLEQFRHEFKRKVMEEMAEKEIKYKSAEQELVKTEQRNDLQILRSPIDGVVQQLTVHTIGGVVSPAEPLMVIVPKADALEVEAFLENKDIGFVAKDQIAEIKIEAFPFTKYGVIEGKVLSVSSDAMQKEDMGLVFAMRSSMHDSTINVNGKNINLSPGMAVSVEVKTGKRNIIEYLVKPLEVMQGSALKER